MSSNLDFLSNARDFLLIARVCVSKNILHRISSFLFDSEMAGKVAKEFHGFTCAFVLLQEPWSWDWFIESLGHENKWSVRLNCLREKVKMQILWSVSSTMNSFRDHQAFLWMRSDLGGGLTCELSHVMTWTINLGKNKKGNKAIEENVWNCVEQ